MDHFEEVAKHYAKPGMRAHYISERKLGEHPHAGQGEIVKDSDGNPVKVRGMVLVHVPEDPPEEPAEPGAQE